MFASKYSAVFLLLLWSPRANQTPLPQPTAEELQERYGDALEAIFGIGVRLQALLEDPSIPSTSNFMVSPLSIALMIGQLMLGAEGKFRDELYTLLSLPESSDQKNSVIHYYSKHKNVTYTLPYSTLHLQMGNLVRALEGKEISKSFILNSSNALFVSSRLSLKDEFLHNLGIYETHVQPLNFSTDPEGCQKVINDWAATRTNGVINNVLASPLPTSASAVFMNAVYFLADWETPFSFEANIKGPFYSTKDTNVEVDYMRGFFENISYGESSKLGCKMMAFPYKNNEMAMYFILPDDNDVDKFNIRKFSERLKTKDVLEFIGKMNKHKVTIQMPKMKLSNTLSFLEPLQRYYMFKNQDKGQNGTGDSLDILDERVAEFTSFNSTEDVEIFLSGAADNQNLKITNILQEMTLSVDEKGTEATAVSLSIVEYLGGNKNFKLDRPFVFFIRHELTSATLFWGTIVNPTKSQ